MEIATNRDEMRICDQQNSQNKKGGLVGSVLKLSRARFKVAKHTTKGILYYVHTDV